MPTPYTRGQRFKHRDTGQVYLMSGDPRPDKALILVHTETGGIWSSSAPKDDPFSGRRDEFVEVNKDGKEIQADVPLQAGDVYRHKGEKDLYVLTYDCIDGRCTGLLVLTCVQSDEVWKRGRRWDKPSKTDPFAGKRSEFEYIGHNVLSVPKAEAPKAEAPAKATPQRGDVYRHKESGSLYMVMAQRGAPDKLMCVTSGDGHQGGWYWATWESAAKSLASSDFEFVGNDCLKL